MMAATGKPKSPGELEKEKKYDRQLRLWGDHGQSALESAHVCLINATATGTEVLKNLILPGIGAYTIVDGNVVSGADVGNNFFLERNSIGESRARIATEFLGELNTDVRGDFLDESPERILEGNPKFFSNFSIVIATSLSEKTLLSLSRELWQDGIPLLVCRSYGMIGYMRLQVPEHTVIETHPDNVISDLRLDKPFPALKDFVDSLNLDEMDYKEHSHTPYVVILLKYLEKWKEHNNANLPQTSEEKQRFREMIKKGIRKKDNEEEENFVEANKAVNTAISKTKVPSDIESLLTDPLCLNLTTESKPFWIMTRALKEFIETDGHDCLPVRGVIPDMTADTEKYVKLQNIYRSQAHEDAQIVYNKVQQLLKSLGKPQDLITENEVKLFCKNSHCLKVIKGRSLAEEYNPETAKVQDIMMKLHNTDSDTVMFYILLRAVDRFYGEYNRFPGYFSEQVEPDIVKLKSCLCRIIQEWGCGPLSKDDYIHEMCRFGAAELHSVAAFIGGCASQEAIKLITGQYVPFNNTFLYDAMTQTTTVYNL